MKKDSNDIYIYADESKRKGQFYSNFYGGALIHGCNHNDVIKALINKKNELTINEKIKWEKVNKSNYERYIEFIIFLFSLIKQNKIQFRIMFSHNKFVSQGLSDEHKRNEYLLLYYQFLKHSFYMSPVHENLTCNVNYYLDKIPVNNETILKFKKFIEYFNFINNPNGNLDFSLGNIKETDCNSSIMIQSVDLILGAIQAKLNQKFACKKKGVVRPVKTRLKEKVYKEIHREIT